MPAHPPGLEHFLSYPLADAILNRRSRRVAQGVSPVNAGTLSYAAASPHDSPQPLSELEEAILIAATGATGYVLPDRPFQDNSPQPHNILGTPNLSFHGRAAGSTDNSQPTFFLMLNDSGTYFLKHLKDPIPSECETLFAPDTLLDRANKCKVKISDKRLFAEEQYRKFPLYLDSNRFLSNVVGSTVFIPIVDMTRQYINALMYVLTEEPKSRPTFVDDRNFYRPAGVRRWMKKASEIRDDEFALNEDLKLPLGKLGGMRTEYESYFLLHNMMLMLEPLGLGGWVHASIGPPYMLGDPFASPSTKGLLNVNWHVPTRSLFQRFTVDLLRWASPLPAMRANPCGLLAPNTKPETATESEWLIRCLCPPNYTVDQAVDVVLNEKQRLYDDRLFFRKVFASDQQGDSFTKQVPHYERDVVTCTKEILQYLYETHGRVPAHCDSLFMPGVCLQAHHLNIDYYDSLFGGRGCTQRHRDHASHWH